MITQNIHWTNNLPSTSANSKVLEDLATELAYNYMSSSFGDEDKPDLRIKEICQDFVVKDLKRRFDARDRVRNIILVGAGASSDVLKFIPLGKDLIEEVKADYENEIFTIEFLRVKFQEVASEIMDISGHPSLSFENYLYLLSRYFVTQKDLRLKIDQMTGFRYSLSLFNEIVAHMLKHSFLDAVINMNFEETLDQSIEEELGSPNYINVLSDGHCVELKEVLVDGRLKTPFYIKPHGTASHKSTLRFTNRHYLDIADDIKKLLKALLSGERGIKNIQKVNLICVGFAMESLEMNKIINESLPPESVIYNIGWEGIETSKIKKRFKLFFDRAESIGIDFDKSYKEIHLKDFSQNASHPLGTITDDPLKSTINKLTTPLCEVFSVLWRLIYQKFTEAFKPRSIAKHEILAYLLYEPSLGGTSTGSTLANRIKFRDYVREDIENNPKYFLDRVVLEIAISINRGNGVVDVVELLDGRAGFYYRKYQECAFRNSKKIKVIYSIYEIISQFDESIDIGSRRKGPSGIPPKKVLNTHLFMLNGLFDNPENSGNQIETVTEKIKLLFDKTPVREMDKEEIRDKKDKEVKITQFLDHLAKTINSAKISLLKKHEKGSLGYDKELLRFNVASTILCRLFMSGMMSNRFRINILKNFSKVVQNGKEKDWEEESPYNTLLQELFRLFSKSVGSHYFVINSVPKNPTHYLWESFSSKKLIHTNLALTYEFNNMFLRRDWDVLLTVSDTGSWLKAVNDKSHLDCGLVKGLPKRKIILICSHEHIRQLYPRNTTTAELIRLHKASLCTGILEDVDLEMTMLPFNQHNYHVVSFIKTLDLENVSFWQDLRRSLSLVGSDDFVEVSNNDEQKAKSTSNSNNIVYQSHQKKLKGNATISSQNHDDQSKEKISNTVSTPSYLFITVGSIFLHRQGFSNSIDPLYIGLDWHEVTDSYFENDQIKILRIFVMHLIRAFAFQGPPKGNTFQDQADPAMPILEQLNTKEFRTNSQSDKPVSQNQLDKFFKVLFQIMVARYKKEARKKSSK